jgi:hypothetical protein
VIEENAGAAAEPAVEAEAAAEPSASSAEEVDATQSTEEGE